MKYVFAVKLNSKEIGLVDLIKDYPQNETAFLGLLLLIDSEQNKGLGRKVYFEVEKFSRDLGCKKIQLGIVDSNPVEEFWKKLGFSLTGKSSPHDGEKIKSIKRVMEKLI